MSQLLGAADKVPNCIAFNSSGHLKAALQPRSAWVLCDEAEMEPVAVADAGSSGGGGSGMQLVVRGAAAAGHQHQHRHYLHNERAGLYVRSQCLPFIEAGCSSWGKPSIAFHPPASHHVHAPFSHFYEGALSLLTSAVARLQMLPPRPRLIQVAGEHKLGGGGLTWAVQ
jgi:hypothetical protein